MVVAEGVEHAVDEEVTDLGGQRVSLVAGLPAGLGVRPASTPRWPSNSCDGNLDDMKSKAGWPALPKSPH